MKKRLLALALCLVMMTSLLPLTAAAYTLPEMKEWVRLEDGSKLESDKVYCGDIYLTINCPVSEGCRITEVSNGSFSIIPPESDGRYKIEAKQGIQTVQIRIYDPQVSHSRILDYDITINSGHAWSAWASNGDGTHSRTCSNGCGTPTTEPPVPCVDANGDHKCDDCKASVHTWQVTKPDSGTLKATCNPGCTIGEVTVKLNAHSVTLPDDPFHATVEVSENFKEAFPSAYITGPEYRYKDSEKGWIDAEPGSFTPKAGQYQAQAYINNLFGDEVAELRAFSKDDGTNQIGNHVDLWVDYTAADPKVTAQTGDNRPIELMLGSVLVFSALAAAAFILDNKRKYQQ